MWAKVVTPSRNGAWPFNPLVIHSLFTAIGSAARGMKTETFD
jgi:hypothetical protein